MLLKTVGFFVLCQILSELVLGHQVTFYKQVKRIVNGGSAYLVFFIFHGNVQILHIKMIISAVNLFENSIAFGSFPKLFVFQVCSKNLSYCLNIAFFSDHKF
ncbi:hypothetical protein FQZ97_1067530 [compost metagenome]